MLKVTKAPYGFEVWYGCSVDARRIKHDLLQRLNTVEEANLGLILCEQPNTDKANQALLQTQIVKSLEKDWFRTGTLSICIIRGEFAKGIIAQLMPFNQRLPRCMSLVDVDMHCTRGSNNMYDVT